ncbi:TOTE conflict system archaeo-eukaryotic primase domain-containing protein [Paraburkholderia heleia]|uniref:TOTE conflict system archaeo-eukaryotic primase domain-containing protein n=1 Tax=Paraburkholderia heleia TaxID=634127 RepID=UPI002AB6F70E|nr:hypothetical protein [Paraburkholderia heleia]
MNNGKLSRPAWEDCTRDKLVVELARLQAENTPLTALLRAAVPVEGKPGQAIPGDSQAAGRSAGTATLSPQQKVQLFRSLFRGRTDVYPLRWESRNSGKPGYAPACAHGHLRKIPHPVRGLCASRAPADGRAGHLCVPGWRSRWACTH